jgi:hypothetical protein
LHPTGVWHTCVGGNPRCLQPGWWASSHIVKLRHVLLLLSNSLPQAGNAVASGELVY